MIKLKKIDKIEDFLSDKTTSVLDVPAKFENCFNLKKNETKDYILKCLNLAHTLSSQKKIIGFINASIDKKIFDQKFLGVTEYLAKKNNAKDKFAMMIYNKKFSVVPITTHLEIKNVTKKINKNLIIQKILTINNFFINFLNKKPKIAILGLNPHNSENRLNSVENKIIKPAVLRLKKDRINIVGPFPADTVFANRKKIKYDVVVGMYHDQVLGPFKTIFGYDALNITLGLKYLRLSPDHGTAKDLVGLNLANPKSLISAIRFIRKTKNV
jgi:4-hydroxythreonine-4-phosphate dehydrogenase